MTDEHQAPGWDQRAVVRAFVGEFRDQGAGSPGGRVVASLAVLVIVVLALVLYGFLTRPPAKPHGPTAAVAIHAPADRRAG
jgi:uncharacterized membrane protein YphA (DoxX/SURF4 family)